MSTVTLPSWYDPQNFNDSGLERTVLDVGEFAVEFEYDAGDPSVGVHAGFDGVAISLKSGVLDLTLFFAYEPDEADRNEFNLPGWKLDDVTIKVAGMPPAGRLPIDLMDTIEDPKLGDYPALLKVVEEKWDAIEAEERRIDDDLAAHHVAMVEREKADHREGKHNDGYDHPECPLCAGRENW